MTPYVDGVYFEADFGVLICKVHGTGIHPTASTIIRHFRSQDHCIRRNHWRRLLLHYRIYLCAL
jgi:hypothetical protein